MIRSLYPIAYGAGYRAGKSPRMIIRMPDGTKRLSEVPNPYPRRHWIKRMAWEDGYHDGTLQLLAS